MRGQMRMLRGDDEEDDQNAENDGDEAAAEMKFGE